MVPFRACVLTHDSVEVLIVPVLERNFSLTISPDTPLLDEIFEFFVYFIKRLVFFVHEVLSLVMRSGRL